MNALNLKDVLSPIVASTALLFTVATFWWNNWRRGKLSTDIPRTYAAHQGSDKFILMLPLAIFNTGAIPIAVTALRLKIGDDGGCIVPYVVTRESMNLERDSKAWEFATNFIVSGRDTILRHCEFTERSVSPLVSGHNHIVVEALLSHIATWRTIGEFELFIDEKRLDELANRYLVYDNMRALPGESSQSGD